MSTKQWSDPKLFIHSDPTGVNTQNVRDKIENLNESQSLVGKIIGGKYKVDKLLGQGGMALVYKAHSMINARPVAIKTLKYRQPDLETRFALEISIHSKLKHPNIVEAIDVITDSDTNLSCFVMEYLEGINLEDLLAKFKRLNSIDDIATVLSQILNALEYAHFYSFIHRDIKPENIIVIKEGNQKIVKVLDFGLAKIEEDLQKLTKTGVVLGSPTYMSPEQCRGDNLDIRTDIYSFGVVAYELITGSPPYQSDDAMELMKFHCDESTVPPSMSTYRPDIPAIQKLDHVIQKTLHSDVELRHIDIYELKEELADWWISATKSNVESPFEFITSKEERRRQAQSEKNKVKDTSALNALVYQKIQADTETYLEEEKKKENSRFTSSSMSLSKMIAVGLSVIFLCAMVSAVYFLSTKVKKASIENQSIDTTVIKNSDGKKEIPKSEIISDKEKEVD